MNASQIRFLYKIELINRELIQGWYKRHKLDNIEKKSFGEILENHKRNFITSIFLFLIASGWAVYCFLQKEDYSQRFGFALSFLAIVFAGVIIRTRNTELGKDLTKLQKFFTKNHMDPYNLHKDIMWLKETATKILNNLGKILEYHESDYGVDSNLAADSRFDFKEGHAICLKFDLCSENQGDYLPRNKKPEKHPKRTTSAKVPLQLGTAPGGT